MHYALINISKTIKYWAFTTELNIYETAMKKKT